MEYRTLGRTGLRVSVISLGSGGPNRFGQSRYASKARIRELVTEALDLGINFFDTAAAYGNSEALLGGSLRGVPRERYLLASKVLPWQGGGGIGPRELIRQVENSLVQLGVEHLDLLQLHRVHPHQYVPVMTALQPAMEKLRTQGKARFFGITESSLSDTGHAMLQRALEDNFFDTVMVSYNLGNPSAARSVIPQAQARNVGVIGMVAARHLVPRSLGQRAMLFGRSLASLATAPPSPDKLRKRLVGIPASLRRGQVKNPVRLYRDDGVTEMTLPEAGYTFVTSHPDIATVLTGTNDIAHLRANVQAALAPALSSAEAERLNHHVAGIAGRT